MNKDAIEYFRHACAWPYDVSEVSDSEFPSGFQEVLAGMGGDLAKARRKLVLRLGRMDKRTLIEELADASCAAIAHHALLRGAHGVGVVTAAHLARVTSDRRKGAVAMHAKSPARKAANRATKLWPRASRNGWTAERMHMELQHEGHAVKQDTVRKWMTKLRKTGIC